MHTLNVMAKNGVPIFAIIIIENGSRYFHKQDMVTQFGLTKPGPNFILVRHISF